MNNNLSRPFCFEGRGSKLAKREEERKEEERMIEEGKRKREERREDRRRDGERGKTDEATPLDQPEVGATPREAARCA